MNSPILGNIGALVVIVLAIFGANWLNQRSMAKQTEMLKMYIDARFDAMRAEFRAEIAPLRTEVAGLNNLIQRIDRQIEAIFKPVLPRSGD